jgi:hypothetical protein
MRSQVLLARGTARSDSLVLLARGTARFDMQRAFALRALALAALLGSAACNESDGTERWDGAYPPESEIDRPKGGVDAGRPPDGGADAATSDGAAGDAASNGDAAPTDAAPEDAAPADAASSDATSGDAGLADGATEAG